MLDSIKPLKIAKRVFDNNLIQGPLAGVSCAPFRLLTWQYSKPAFTYTEMISCKTIVHMKQLGLDRYTKKYTEEGPVCFQLAGVQPTELAQATQKITDYGADLIDLNCGCPANKIRAKGYGSKLLVSPLDLYHAIKAIKQQTHVPVGIKIRVEGKSTEKFHQDLVQVIKDAGCDFVTVHGRHWQEGYDSNCHYEQINYFVDQLDIPVIGNGDVSCQLSLQKMLSTGCAGVMISRAGVGQPWLIGQLKAGMKAEPFTSPIAQDIGFLLLQHAQCLITLLNREDSAIFQMRKIAKYYGRALPDRAIFVEHLKTCVNLKSLQKLCQQFFMR